MNFMSTKSTLAYNGFLHAYNDAFNDNDVGIDFSFNDPRIRGITVNMTSKDALVLYSGLHAHAQSVMTTAFRSEEDIRKMVISQVEKRMAKKGVYAHMGVMIYGDVESSLEAQVEKGMKFYSELKSKKRDIIDEAKKDIDDPDLCSIIFEDKTDSFDPLERISFIAGKMNTLIEMNKIDLLDECLSELNDISKNKESSCSSSHRLKINDLFNSIVNKIDRAMDSQTPILFDVGE